MTGEQDPIGDRLPHPPVVGEGLLLHAVQLQSPMKRKSITYNKISKLFF